MVLIDKDLWNVVEASEKDSKAAASSKDGDDLAAKDKKALATICLSIKDSELVHVRTCKTSAEAWKKLGEVYETKGLARRLFLRRKFFTIQLQEGESMQEHINKVTTLAEQLEAIGATISDDDIAMTLLCSLPESYESLLVALESRTDNLTAEIVRTRLLQEEARRKENTVKEESAFFVKGGKGKKEWQRPSEGEHRNRDKKTVMKCFHCGKKGHKAVECRKRLAEKSQAKRASEDAAFIAAYIVSPGNDNEWYVDSGATQHLSSRKEWFHQYKDISPRNIYLANNHVIIAKGMGTVHVNLMVKGEKRNISFQDVLYVPELHGNLLSVNRIVACGYKVLFDESGCAIQDRNGSIVAAATKERNLYRLSVTPQEVSDRANFAEAHKADMALWHQRMGHLGVDSIRKLVTNGMVKDLDLHDDNDMELCKGCILGKQNRRPFPTNGTKRAKDILELIHTDVCGPMKQTSLGGSRYFLTFIDDKTRNTFVYFLKSKNEVFTKFQEFKALVEKQTGKNIKILRSDNGGEYVSHAFDMYLKSNGIQHQTTIAYTPEQNGVAERANRTIVERARSMLHSQELGYELWAEAVAAAVYLKNRSPTKAVPNMTPEEAWSGLKPSVAHLRAFGCKAYAHIPKQKRNKFDSKSLECIFVGYLNNSKGYRLFNPITRTVIESRDVIFNEQRNAKTEKGTAIADLEVNIKADEVYDQRVPKPEIDISSEPLVDETSHEKDDLAVDKDVQETACGSDYDDDTIVVDTGKSPEPSTNINIGETKTELRRSNRERKAPTRYGRGSEYAGLTICNDEPQTFEEAISRPDSKKWEQAAQKEYDSILKNKTWNLVDLPPGRKAIGCKWVFKIKYNAAGDIERYKARLVAKGYSQTQGIDFNETFAPVAKFTSIRILLALAAKHDLEMHQMDVNTAFLNGDLKEEIYMQQPEGFIQAGQEDKVCKLQRSIYGLKQAGRSWYDKIDASLSDMGLTRAHADNCVYYRNKNGTIIIVAIYVDDLLILANNMTALHNLKAEISQRFDMKDLGEVHFCLGIQVFRNRHERSIRISQAKYVENILKRFNMLESKPIGTPLDANYKLTKEMSPVSEKEAEEMRSVPYQSAIGSLMYAMLGTRPDIAYAVGAVSQYCSNPGRGHWTAVKRIFRYLKGTRNYALEYKGSGHLVGYSDADWAGNVDDRRSTTGYTFLIAGGAVSWSSKKQPTVALSTTEAEYMALSHATKEAVWIQRFLAEIGFGLAHQTSTIIHTDNQGAIALAKNSVHHARTKHIDIKHHFIREKVETGEVKLVFCRTEDMVADVLTKGLSKERHGKCTRMMGLPGDNQLMEDMQSGSVGE